MIHYRQSTSGQKTIMIVTTTEHSCSLFDEASQLRYMLSWRNNKVRLYIEHPATGYPIDNPHLTGLEYINEEALEFWDGIVRWLDIDTTVAWAKSLAQEAMEGKE